MEQRKLEMTIRSDGNHLELDVSLAEVEYVESFPIPLSFDGIQLLEERYEAKRTCVNHPI